MCPICNKRVAIRRDGRLRSHGYLPGDATSLPCLGANPARPKAARHARTGTEPVARVPRFYEPHRPGAAHAADADAQ